MEAAVEEEAASEVVTELLPTEATVAEEVASEMARRLGCGAVRPKLRLGQDQRDKHQAPQRSSTLAAHLDKSRRSDRLKILRRH